jgi:hypothetical protein
MTMSLVVLTFVYFLLVTYYIYKAILDLQRHSFTEFRVANTSARLQVRAALGWRSLSIGVYLSTARGDGRAAVGDAPTGLAPRFPCAGAKSLEQMGCIWSYSTSRIRLVVPIWQPYIRPQLACFGDWRPAAFLSPKSGGLPLTVLRCAGAGASATCCKRCLL